MEKQIRFSLESLIGRAGFLEDYDYNESTGMLIFNKKRREWRDSILVCSKGIIKFLLDNINDYKFFDEYSYKRQESTKALFDDYLYNRWDEFCDFLSDYVREIGYERWDVYEVYDTSKEFCQGRILTTIVEEFKKNDETLEALSEGDYLNESDFRVLKNLADDFIIYLEDIREGEVLPDWAADFAHQTSAVDTGSGGAANEAMPHAMASKPAKGGKNELPLPGNTNTKRAQKYFRKAIEAGLMEYKDGSFNWKGTGCRGLKSQLAYFVGLVYGYQDSAHGNKGERLPWEELCGMFSQPKLQTLLAQVYNATKEQPWRRTINEIFEGIE